MHLSTRVASAVLALCASASAQFGQVAVSFAPNPAPPGSMVAVTVTNSTAQNLNLPSPCTWIEVHAGAQTGPLVPIGGFCITVIVPLAPGASYSLQWDQIDGNTGLPVPPGRYWWKTRIWDAPFAQLIEDWFCLDVRGPNEPALAVGGTIRVGQANPYTMSAPALPNQIYTLLFSFSSNQPITVPGLVDLCVSAPLISARDGVLGPLGTDAWVFGLPNQPGLVSKGFHFQGLILDAITSTLVDTNDLSLTIAP